MIEGLYTAAAGMAAQQNQLDAIANDIANQSTPGYQGTRLGFHDLLYTSGGASAGSTVATGAGAATDFIGRSQVQGAIQETGQPLDVAILGEGFIEVRRPDGTIGLTRNGTLQVDAQGRLATTTGMLLQPPVRIPRGTPESQIKIAPDGTVSAGNRKVGKITLVTVPAPDKLLSDGDSVFSATAASGAIRRATGTNVQQGALEGSNVDEAAALIQMVDSQWGYQMSSKAVQMQDQMLQIANQVKR